MFIFKRLFIIAIAILILSNNVIAQEESKALPDDPLYQAKRKMETAQLNAKVDPLEKANLRTKYAQERLVEVKAMISKGKPEFVGELVKDYEKAIAGVMEEINRALGYGRDVSGALKAVERATKKHTEVLTKLLGKVPEEAKSAITHAIEVSKHGRNRALDVLKKIQKGELPVGKPEDVGKPEGVGRPKGIDKPEGGRKPEDIGRPSGDRPAGGGGGGRGR